MGQELSVGGSTLITPTEASLRAALEALKPFADFARMYDAKPLRQMDDRLYGIHAGTEWEAILTLTHLRKAAEVYAALQPKGKADV